MHAYSQDLRDRVLRALDRGDRPVAIAERFEVSREEDRTKGVTSCNMILAWCRIGHGSSAPH